LVIIHTASVVQEAGLEFSRLKSQNISGHYEDL